MQHAKPPILLVITLAEPGGATQFVLRFAKYLQKQGENVRILAGDGQWLFDRCQETDLPIERLSALGRALHPWRDLKASWQLFAAFRRLKPRAIHLNSTKAGAIGAIAARFANVPHTVYRIGGWVFLERLPTLTKWLYLKIEQMTALWKDIIVCVHPGDEEIARKEHILPRHRLITIPNGIDAELFQQTLFTKEDSRTQLGLPQNTFIFGTIAHFYPAKQLAFYLEACAQVHQQNPEALFVIIGDGPERTRLEAAIQRHNLIKSVILLGEKDQAARSLLAFDAFVLPSAKEGMPSALLEAMVAGVPCIATDVGACAWMLEKNGLIVSATNAQELAQAMLTVLHNPQDAKKRADRAQAEAIARFPLNALLAQQANLLTKP